MGYHDLAGSGVVFVTSGTISLWGSLIIGKRLEYQKVSQDGIKLNFGRKLE